ncbi:MAG: VapE domain-containing protein [Nonlabens sp.]|uniref:VapE domain-containing protein n=1 Tax=Nonlabens sp. TaxID=1888209 RepID=UPI003EF877FB
MEELHAYDQSDKKESVYDRIHTEFKKYYKIKFNEIALEYEIFDKRNGEMFHFNKSSLLIHLNRENITTSSQVIKTYLKSHFIPHYNPLVNYFENLPKWDGIDYIKQYASYVKTDDDNLYYYHLKKWAVRAIKTIHLNGQINKHCIILANGDQNAGKSTYLANFCPNHLRQYYYENIGVKKDDRIKLCKAWMINIEELDILGKYDINSIKSIISQITVNERLPYADKSTLLYRTCSFMASTNNAEFLTDPTGNVRWIAFEVIGKINFNYSEEFDINNFWTQAYNIYKNVPDFKSDLSNEDVQINEKRNEKFMVQSLENESLLQYYNQCDDNNLFRTANDIVKELATLGIKVCVQKIGSSLKKHGYKRYKHSKRQVYGYNAKPSFK